MEGERQSESAPKGRQTQTSHPHLKMSGNEFFFVLFHSHYIIFYSHFKKSLCFQGQDARHTGEKKGLDNNTDGVGGV